MTEMPKEEKMDFKQLQMDHRQPQNEKQCPDASPESQKVAASGKQLPPARAQSCVPALQNPCSSPGPSSAHKAAQTLSKQRSVLAAPEPREGAWANKEEKRVGWSPLSVYQGQRHMEHEISQEEVRRFLELSRGDNDSDKTSSHENWGRITIRTIWVNPRYPELWQVPLQEEAMAATSSSSDEEVAAAEAQSTASDIPCSSPCSSHTQLAAQTLSDLQGVPRQPSGRRRTLQNLRALCTLFWCSCMEAQLDN